MACNGNNHVPNCNCGWGGVANFKFSPARDKNGTFVLNAKCPVCSKPVFYYQNKHGSKVFFDSLGHPWPKHPCTISKKDEQQTGFASSKWVIKYLEEVEKSELFKNKYSVKHSWKRNRYMFFFTSEDLDDFTSIRVLPNGQSPQVRIQTFDKDSKQACILEGPGYYKHPSAVNLKRLKKIKLGGNKVS